MIRRSYAVRHAEPTDAERWTAFRVALWPDQSPSSLGDDVTRFFAAPDHRAGAMPEAVLVACDATAGSTLLGFAEVSRRAYAEGWARNRGCNGVRLGRSAENADSAAAHRALGFEEVEVIRCFRKGLASRTAT